MRRSTHETRTFECVLNTLSVLPGYQKRCMRKWNALPGVTVAVSSCDICVQSEAEELIAQTQQTMAPVGGIFHLAMVSKLVVNHNYCIHTHE